MLGSRNDVRGRWLCRLPRAVFWGRTSGNVRRPVTREGGSYTEFRAVFQGRTMPWKRPSSRRS